MGSLFGQEGDQVEEITSDDCFQVGELVRGKMSTSEYEELRMRNIRNNHAELNSLFGQERDQLEKIANDRKIAKENKRASSLKRKRVKAEPGLARPLTRRSRRLAEVGNVKIEPKEIKTEPNPINQSIIEEEVKRPSLEELQQSLNQVFNNAAKIESKGEQLEWRTKAVSLWGQKVLNISPPDVDWKKYVLSRQPVEPKNYTIASPLGLLQEQYADDTWRLLIACCLMSRVSSAKVKQECLAAFFNKCPTPSKALDIPPGEIEPILHPLGLFQSRYRSILELSRQFLVLPEFTLDLKAHKVYGFGEFAFDSYLLFCKGMATKCVPKDKTLRAYCSWAKASCT